MSTTIGTLRETLIDSIEKVKSGTMDTNKANAIAKLAAAVTANLQAELNAMGVLNNMKNAHQVGALLIGGETIANEIETIHAEIDSVDYEKETKEVLSTGNLKTVKGNVTTHKLR